MQSRQDIHNYKRQFERSFQKIQDSKDFSLANKKVISEFKDELLAQGIGLAKIGRYMTDLKKFNSLLKKDFSDANKKDIKRVIAELNQTGLSEETKKGIKIMLRKLYRFIRGIDKKGVYPEEVEWISISIPNNHNKLPEELLTDKEIFEMIQKAGNMRNKAFVSTLAESGCRISEVATMKIRNVSFEEYGARLHVKGKTGMRKILIVNSTPYLKEWINQHPNNSNPDSCLWPSADGSPLSYARLATLIKDSAKKAGVKKRVYPHLLRHSRATILAKKMSDCSMKNYFGWAMSSKMTGIYVHMAGEDSDQEILEANGIEIKKNKKDSPMKAKTCLRCHTQNEATNLFCKKCGLSLNSEEAEKVIEDDTKRGRADEVINKLLKDPDIFELIKKKLS